MPRPDDLIPALPSRHLPTELLRRYVAGELNPAQEHAVEAHTLECERCAEVLEGLELQPAPVTDASLAELRQRLNARVAQLADEAPAGAVVRPLWWRPLAAAAVLLLTLGAVAWLMLRPVARPEIAAHAPQTAEKARRTAPAVVPPTETAIESADALTVHSSPEVAVVLPPARPVAPVLEGATGRASATPPMVRANRADAGVAAEPASRDDVADKAAAESTESASYAAATPPTAAPDQPATSSRAAKRAETGRALPAAAAPAVASTLATEEGRTVQGRIVDTAGQPLPGATVQVPGARTGVSTGADGRFALTVPPGSRQLAVSSIGYTTQTRFLQAADSTLTLALAPDTKQLSEVVVVRREAPPSLPSIGPMPAGGYPTFRQYLRDSLDYPEKAREKRLEGYVRLQFIVGIDGKLTDIKVVSKLSPECDEEAIRLLKEGPAWFPGVQNNRRTARKVELKVPFFLEKR